MRAIMLNVCRIDQCDHNVDVKQIPFQSNSSWSWRTNSEVTLGAPGRTGSSGTPLRVARLDEVGRIDLRASAEITSPTLFRSVAAISLAAARTSSSIASVVRILGSLGENITHQSSYTKCGISDLIRRSE
jgi:hypothetical protein